MNLFSTLKPKLNYASQWIIDRQITPSPFKRKYNHANYMSDHDKND